MRMNEKIMNYKFDWRFRSKGPQKTDDYFGVKPPKKDPIINKKGMELGSRASIFRSIATHQDLYLCTSMIKLREIWQANEQR